MKLNKKLEPKHFIISQLFILVFGLIALGFFYYILNIQYQTQEKPFLNGPITTTPKSLLLDLNQPDDDLMVFAPSILVSGKTGPLKEVLISTDSDDLIIKSKQDGSFSTELSLNEGVNRIMVVVFDTTGETRSLERTVFYSKEKL